MDFIAPQNTPVLVAADGVVVFVSDNSNIGGPDPSYWTTTNYVTVKHSFGEYSRYDHLHHKSAKVRVGQQVPAGRRDCQCRHDRLYIYPTSAFSSIRILINRI